MMVASVSFLDEESEEEVRQEKVEIGGAPFDTKTLWSGSTPGERFNHATAYHLFRDWVCGVLVQVLSDDDFRNETGLVVRVGSVKIVAVESAWRADWSLGGFACVTEGDLLDWLLKRYEAGSVL